MDVEPLRLVEIRREPEPPPPRTASDLLGDALSAAALAYRARDARSAHDDEDLHQARVALRRIRSYLRTFRSVVDPVWASAVRAELGWYGALLGEVRNFDVMAGRVSARAGEGEDLVGYKELLAAIDVARKDALRKLDEARDLPRYQSVLSYLDALARRELRFGAGASEEAAAASARLMRRPWRSVRAAEKNARRTPSESNLHALRIRAKELRYASELVAGIFGAPATRLAKSAQKVQDRLGEHRDALGTALFARHAALEHPSCAYAAGQLVVIERLAAEHGLGGLGADLSQLRSRWRGFERAAPSTRR
jgi:CHAD domain-containing protein